MTALSVLRAAAMDGLAWGATPAQEIVVAMADTLEAFLAEEKLTAFQQADLESLVWGMRLLAYRMEVEG